MSAQPAAVIVLAAGEGTRMRSATPKVLHPLAGRSLLGHVLTTAGELRAHRTAVVVRHGRDEVAAHARDVMPEVLIADQDEIPGTGRAVHCGLDVLDAVAQAGQVAQQSHEAAQASQTAEAAGAISGAVVVTAGDVPLLNGGTLAELVAAHEANGNGVTLLSAYLSDPHGYGRVLRNEAGAVIGVVEERDADETQRAITEVNTSVYVFDAALLRQTLSQLGSANKQGEVYLTDVVAEAHHRGRDVQALAVEDEWLVTGVNDRLQLAQVAAELNRRTGEDWMRQGVSIIDPATTWIDVDVILAPDVTIAPGTQLHGTTIVGEGARIGPETTLHDVSVGPGADVVRCHGSGSSIGPGCHVGPYTYLRPGTQLGEAGKIGSFVETKNTSIGAASKVPHLSYVGDAEIGEDSNIGAATIFVNYDGVTKHRTTVGRQARTGSGNMFVAPVTIGDGAYTGAGAVVRRDVPPGSLAINVAPQRNVERWVLRRRPDTPAAEAAADALAHEDEPTPQARAEPARSDQGPPTPRDGDASTTTFGRDSER